MYNNIPVSFMCPISHKLMLTPVFTDPYDGFIYERQSILEWIEKCRSSRQAMRSPITGSQLNSAKLTSYVALQKAIEAFLLHSPELADYRVTLRAERHQSEQEEVWEKFVSL